jgi:hypothetical protein
MADEWVLARSGRRGKRLFSWPFRALASTAPPDKNGSVTKPASLLFLVLLLAAAPANAACPAGQSPMLTVRLYFGLMADGKRVPEQAWGDFLARTVTPRFPSGFTVYDATGQWRDRRTNIIGREPSRVIEIDAQDGAKTRNAVEEIRKAYGARFHQQSVGIVTLPACGAF